MTVIVAWETVAAGVGVGIGPGGGRLSTRIPSAVSSVFERPSSRALLQSRNLLAQRHVFRSSRAELVPDRLQKTVPLRDIELKGRYVLCARSVAPTMSKKIRLTFPPHVEVSCTNLVTELALFLSQHLGKHLGGADASRRGGC